MDDIALEEAKASIKEFGFNPDDFEFTHLDTTKIGPGIVAETGQMTIRNKLRNATRVYNTGHGTARAVAFDGELKAGYFR